MKRIRGKGFNQRRRALQSLNYPHTLSLLWRRVKNPIRDAQARERERGRGEGRERECSGRGFSRFVLYFLCLVSTIEIEGENTFSIYYYQLIFNIIIYINKRTIFFFYFLG